MDGDDRASGPAADDAGATLHARVYRTLRDEIIGGVYGRDGMLPSDKELGERFDVSRITVRKALDDLALAGLILRQQGRRTRVSPQELPVTGDVETEIANTLAIGRGTVPQILSFDWVRAGHEVAAQLGTSPDTLVLRVTRLRRRAGRPVLHTLAYLPESVGRGIVQADLETTQMLTVLERRGVVFGGADQEISAGPCPKPLAKLLELEEGAPVLRLARLLRDIDRKPVQFVTATFRWDSFTYKVALKATGEIAGAIVP